MNVRDRFEVEEQSIEGSRSVLYVIRDKADDELVLGSDGTLEAFAMRHSAEHWVTSQIMHGRARSGR